MTQPMNSLADFMQQRIRWASKAKHFKDVRLQWILLLVYVYNFFYVLLGILSFIEPKLLILLAFYLLWKCIIEGLLLWQVLGFFNKKRELIIFPFLQLAHIPYILLSGSLGLIGNYTWKDRNVS
jgi:hypothetical protein